MVEIKEVRRSIGDDEGKHLPAMAILVQIAKDAMHPFHVFGSLLHDLIGYFQG
jgi:hypothetical protein